jgi:hypothetical protein
MNPGKVDDPAVALRMSVHETDGMVVAREHIVHVGAERPLGERGDLAEVTPNLIPPPVIAGDPRSARDVQDEAIGEQIQIGIDISLGLRGVGSPHEGLVRMHGLSFLVGRPTRVA